MKKSASFYVPVTNRCLAISKVSSISDPVCAAETNPASNAEGAR